MSLDLVKTFFQNYGKFGNKFIKNGIIYMNLPFIYFKDFLTYSLKLFVLVDRDTEKQYCIKSVRIWSYSGPHFPAFELNVERWGVSVRILSECGEIRTRITPNTDTFHAEHVFV